MIDRGALDKAIGAHGMWKTRLSTAVKTGKLDTPVEQIRKDDQCEFGKWLAGAASGAAASKHFHTVKDLHAKFHQAAATVAQLAIAGKKDEAERMLSMQGEFAQISAKLTGAMMDWKKEVA